MAETQTLIQKLQNPVKTRVIEIFDGNQLIYMSELAREMQRLYCSQDYQGVVELHEAYVKGALAYNPEKLEESKIRSKIDNNLLDAAIFVDIKAAPSTDRLVLQTAVNKVKRTPSELGDVARFYFEARRKFPENLK